MQQSEERENKLKLAAKKKTMLDLKPQHLVNN